MRKTWVAIRPGMRGTRVLGMMAAGETILKARLRTSPVHPRAVSTLLEAIALGGTQDRRCARCGRRSASVRDKPLSRMLPRLRAPPTV